MRRSTEASIGCRIFTTIRAYINSGANLDHIIYLSREARVSATWRRLPESAIPRYGDSEHVTDVDSEHATKEDSEYVTFEITTESNTCQLVQDTKSFMEDHLAQQDPDIQYKLDDLGTGNYKGYRKVLYVSKSVSSLDSDIVHRAAASQDDFDYIFKLLDSERVSGRWTSEVFEAELRSLLERILETGEKVGNISPRLFEHGIGGLGNYVWDAGISKVKRFYEAIFPNLALEEDTDSEDTDSEEISRNLTHEEDTDSERIYMDLA